jgi:hypothetical protein
MSFLIGYFSDLENCDLVIITVNCRTNRSLNILAPQLPDRKWKETERMPIFLRFLNELWHNVCIMKLKQYEEDNRVNGKMSSSQNVMVNGGRGVVGLFICECSSRPWLGCDSPGHRFFWKHSMRTAFFAFLSKNF